ncbi:MAG TPA: hypothetical protein ENN06_10265 [Desulfobacteraceae bacterium]|nr:hypothetical protein [Desulfobacteraceae bacterium]
MKRKLLLLLTCLLAVAVPFGVMAMNHEKEMSHQGHGGMEAAEGAHEQSMHDMAGHAGAIMLGSMVEEGVKATAQLNDMREVMASMGMK